MLGIFWWLLIITLFIASFVGLLFPVIPSTLFIWAGFIIYHFGMKTNELGMYFWIGMTVFTIGLLLADIIANSYFVRRFGGSPWGERAAAVGVIVGSFIVPPFGIFIVPLGVVLLVEIMQKKPFRVAWKAAVGSFIGFLSGILAKIVIQIVMILWFIFGVIF